jgi:hypothetical protein
LFERSRARLVDSFDGEFHFTGGQEERGDHAIMLADVPSFEGLHERDAPF